MHHVVGISGGKQKACVVCEGMFSPRYNQVHTQKTCLKPICRKEYRRTWERQNSRAKSAALNSDSSDFVVCLICGDKVQYMAHAHLRRHGMTTEDYMTQFPNARLMNNSSKMSRIKGAIARSVYLTYGGQNPDKRLCSFLTGSLLGDGHLDRRSDGRQARYAEGGSNQDYLTWKHSILKDYFRSSFVKRHSAPHVKTGKSYLGWWIRTSVHPFLTDWHQQWYRDRRKVIPYPLVEAHLDAFALAVWFFDDGYLGSGAHIYTLAFSCQEVEWVCDLIKARFSIPARLRLLNGQPEIFIPKDGKARLLDTISPFTVPGMEYKCGN